MRRSRKGRFTRSRATVSETNPSAHGQMNGNVTPRHLEAAAAATDPMVADPLGLER